MAHRRTTALASAVVLVLGGLVAGCAQDPPDPGVSVVQGFERLEPPAFAERMDEPGTVVLDVRTQAEYAAGHLPGAVHLDVGDLGAADVDAAVARLDPGTSYALYCADGTRSFPAMVALAARGVDDVFDLAGGTRAWQAHGGTLTRR